METMLYNVKRKIYPDGTEQFSYYEKPKMAGYEVGERKKTGLHVDRKEIENASRAVRKVYDLARSNEFDWFVTMTFDKNEVDRFDYDSCADALKRFTDILRHNGNKWVIIPEQHKDGAFHFHGLVSGTLPVTAARSPKTGRLLKDRNGNQIFNVDNFRFGHTTATKIGDRVRAATYLTKYLTKEISVPKGRKRYWASRGLNKPSEELMQMTPDEYGEIFNNARYQKVINTLCWGSFLMCET